MRGGPQKTDVGMFVAKGSPCHKPQKNPGSFLSECVCVYVCVCTCVCVVDEFCFVHLEFQKAVDHLGEDFQQTVVQVWCFRERFSYIINISILLLLYRQ